MGCFRGEGRKERVQLAPPIARAGRLIQVVPHTIQDDPRESTCKAVTPDAADVLGLHRLCDWFRRPDVLEVLRGKSSGYQVGETINIRASPE
jgi:hypothetical protein